MGGSLRAEDPGGGRGGSVASGGGAHLEDGSQVKSENRGRGGGVEGMMESAPAWLCQNWGHRNVSDPALFFPHGAVTSLLALRTVGLSPGGRTPSASEPVEALR